MHTTTAEKNFQLHTYVYSPYKLCTNLNKCKFCTKGDLIVVIFALLFVVVVIKYCL